MNNEENELVVEYDYTKIETEKLQQHINSCVEGAPWIKEKYDVGQIKNYKDVPGWINDAQLIFKEAVNNCKDGDMMVEIGTYFGQSACFMGELIRDSKKSIKFDTIDIFDLDASMRAGFHPQQFIDYRFSEGISKCPMSELVKSHFDQCNVSDYVNLVICDAKYAHKLYDDNSLLLVYTDGINNKDNLHNFLVNFWPKLKPGGIIAGDDIVFEDVKNGVKSFCETVGIEWDAVQMTHLSWSIKK